MSHILEIPKWFDLHTHFRQGELVASYISDHLEMGCAGALAMPNTLPPVSKIDGENSEFGWSIESYRGVLLEAGGDQFEELIVPLYLTKETTAQDIERGAKSGQLKAAKYYPPHGTTNSAHGVPIENWIGSDVLKAIEANDVILCLHGEQHGLTGAEYFDSKHTAESKFYQNWMPKLRDTHPGLKMVCEHITTEAAVAFVESSVEGKVAATITPQHLLYTVGHLIQGLRYHLYCLPIVKFENDREALRQAAAKPGQPRFFAGTDSAPHTDKVTECGCAAGCYTGGCAPQLYAMAFEEAGVNLATPEGIDSFRRFLSANGPEFYGFPVSSETFQMVRERRGATKKAPVTSLPEGMGLELEWSIV